MYRIGFDAKRLFNNSTGLGNYSRTLVNNLAYYHPENAYFLYSPKLKKNEDTQEFLNSPSYSVCTPNGLKKPAWRFFRIRQQLKQHKLDLYHGLSNEIPLGLDDYPIKKIVSIHDLIYKHFPQQYGVYDRQVYNLKTKYACEHSDTIIAISESTKKDIIDFYQIPEEKIKVVYQSCSEHFFQDKSDALIEKMSKKYQLPEEYMLYVGSITERKNLLGILKAMTLLPKEMEVPLVIIGNGKAYKQEALEFIAKNQLTKHVHFIDPKNEDLPFIYQKAALFVYPSFYEGFGIPIIEALFSKTPVITSNCSSLPEAAGPDSILIAPNSPEAIADAIDRVLSDAALQTQMIERGYAYAQQFRGEPLTEQLVRVYDSVLQK
jgi:glycosyltransferase involved in cell wall biosynthesis